MTRHSDALRHDGLVPGVCGLLALDVVGGSLAVATGWNTPAQAWSGQAVLVRRCP